MLLCRNVWRKISTCVNGGLMEGLACADPGARTPIGASGISRLDSMFCMQQCWGPASSVCSALLTSDGFLTPFSSCVQLKYFGHP